MFKRLFKKINSPKKISSYSKFETELNSDFNSMHIWVKRLWDLSRKDYLDPDVILIKQNMFIISLHSLLENYFEKIVDYAFDDYLNNNINSGQHFYLAKSFFIQSEKDKIIKIIKGNHNGSYTKGFLNMLEKILNSSSTDFKVFNDQLDKEIENEMIKKGINFESFKSILGNIKEARDSLGHNFHKFFSNNSIDYKSAYFKDVGTLEDGMKIIYKSLENTLNIE